MKRTESAMLYAACELLLLNGAPTSAIQNFCFERFQTEPSATAVKKWRKKIGVPSRQTHTNAFPKPKPFNPFTPEETDSLALYRRLSQLMAKPTELGVAA